MPHTCGQTHRRRKQLLPFLYRGPQRATSSRANQWHRSYWKCQNFDSNLPESWLKKLWIQAFHWGLVLDYSWIYDLGSIPFLSGFIPEFTCEQSALVITFVTIDCRLKKRFSFYHTERRIEKIVIHSSRDVHKAVGIISETANTKTFAYPFKSEVKVSW